VEVRQTLVGAVEAQVAPDVTMAQPDEGQLRAYYVLPARDAAKAGPSVAALRSLGTMAAVRPCLSGGKQACRLRWSTMSARRLWLRSVCSGLPSAALPDRQGSV
jgi:hypothetical protein